MQKLTLEGTGLLYRSPHESPAPAVIVIHEVTGVNDDIRDIAGRIHDHGYAVAVPDLYSGGAKPLCIARTVLDANRNHGRGSAERIGRVRAWLGAQAEIDADRIGVIGFCLGAGIALMAAARSDVAAASVNYGEVPEDTALLEGICPVVGSYGGEDARLLPSAQRLEEALARMRVPHDVKIYEGAGHSFLNRSVPGLVQRFASVGYQPSQAADAWERIFAFFDEHLDRA